MGQPLTYGELTPLTECRCPCPPFADDPNFVCEYCENLIGNDDELANGEQSQTKTAQVVDQAGKRVSAALAKARGEQSL